MVSASRSLSPLWRGRGWPTPLRFQGRCTILLLVNQTHLRALVVPILVLLLTCSPAGTGRSVRPRHIILISIDTLRSDHLGAYGYTRARTPNLDAFARDGILFEHAFSHSPLTLPSHASMLTGMLPAGHGLRDNIGFRKSDGIETVPQMLKRNGFATGAVVSAFVLRKASGIDQGFDYFDDAIREHAGESLGGIQRNGSESVALAREWIRQKKDKPFFFFLHLYEPHAPYDAPDPLRSSSATPYDADVSLADSFFGSFVQFLQSEKIYDDALIFLVSDHGEGLGDHGEAEHGIFLYREAIQVPVIIKIPRNARGGSRVQTPIQLIDLRPTIQAAAGISSLEGTVGMDVLSNNLNEKRKIYSETYYPRLHFGWSDLHSLIENGKHYIHAPLPELYDINADPAEKINRFAEDRRSSSAMRQAIAPFVKPIRAPEAIDPEEARKLAALGYLGGSSSVQSGETLADPKSKTATFRELQAAFALFRKGDDARAIPLFRSILRQNPGMVDLYEITAKSLSRAGQSEEAIQMAKEGLRIAPQSDSLVIILTNLLIESGGLDDAWKHTELFLTRHPGKAHEMRARIAIERRDLQLATSEAKAALSGDEKVLAMLTLGRIEREKRNYPAALTHFDAALRESERSQKPPLVGLQYLRGDTLARLGKNSEAEKALRSEIVLSPTDPRAYQSLILLLMTDGRTEDATRLLRTLIETAPTSRSYISVARTLRVLGDERGVRYWASQGLKKYPRDRELRDLAGR